MPIPTSPFPGDPTAPPALSQSAAPLTRVFAAAKAHGEHSEPEHEVGDLNDFDRLSASTKARIEAGIARFLPGEGRGTSE